MAFLSQSGSSHGPLTLPLFKLSFCTATTHGSKLMWTHLTKEREIFAVFDQIKKFGLGGSITEKKLLKLTCGGDLLVCLLKRCLSCKNTSNLFFSL